MAANQVVGMLVENVVLAVVLGAAVFWLRNQMLGGRRDGFEGYFTKERVVAWAGTLVLLAVLYFGFRSTMGLLP